MNYGVVRYILGRILQAEGCFLVFPVIVGIIYGESDIWAYLITMGICLAVGTLMSIRKPQKGGLFLKEGFFVVGLGWIFMSLFGAIPFVISGDIPNYIDAVFETSSFLLVLRWMFGQRHYCFVVPSPLPVSIPLIVVQNVCSFNLILVRE